MRSINNLNEELARWAFEIIFIKNTSWRVAFTNPTAGPWKTIKATSKTSYKVGEVYRFLLEEDRPDIIMYNDELQLILIIEAKDNIKKLLEEDQARKSADVVVKLSNILRSNGENLFWKGREYYKVVIGLLWGSTDKPESAHNKDRLYSLYKDLLKDEDVVLSTVIIGIETLYTSDNLHCSIFYKSYDPSYEELGAKIIRSLKHPYKSS